MEALTDDKLNENQRAALEADAKPTLVLAGPGSGKTAVLTARLAHVIGGSPDQHFRVLGLTFTKKAATEMQERARTLLGGDLSRAVLTTFHSFAAEILRQHGSHVGIRPDFSVLVQQADREAVLEQVIREAQEEYPELERREVRLLPLIDNLLEKLVHPDDAADHIRDPELAETLSLLYGRYRSRLLNDNTLDFSTLLCLAFELLRDFPLVAEQLRSVYVHILVDEFQDTNLAQFMFLKELVGSDPSYLFVVADDDQIIYQWNGADPRRLAELQKTYRMRIVQLPTNYRCPSAVIDLANSLILHNHGERAYAKEPLRAAAPGQADAVVLKDFPTAAGEAEWIAAELASLSQEERAKTVVLARTKRLLSDAQSSFAAKGVESVLAIRKSDFESAPFRWLMAMLRLAVESGDRAQLSVATRSFFRMEGIELAVDDVVASAAARGGDLLRSFIEEALAREEALSPATAELLSGAARGLVDRMDYQAFIDDSLEWFGSLDSAVVSSHEKAFADFEVEIEIWSSLGTQTRNRFPPGPIPLPAFLQELDLSPKTLPIPPGAVRCYTIHNAKGMEFPRVFLMGLTEDVLPSFQAIKEGDESIQMQEERRNCFVGITRTSERLIMTYAREYFGWSKEPSRFLGEMGALSAGDQ
jgi:DNA helicase II / ATP-dependent DNA helicase PcrA